MLNSWPVLRILFNYYNLNLNVAFMISIHKGLPNNEMEFSQIYQFLSLLLKLNGLMPQKVVLRQLIHIIGNQMTIYHFFHHSILRLFIQVTYNKESLHAFCNKVNSLRESWPNQNLQALNYYLNPKKYLQVSNLYEVFLDFDYDTHSRLTLVMQIFSI